MNQELKAIQDEIVTTTKALYEALKDKTDEHDEKLIGLKSYIEDLHARISRPDTPQRKDVGGIEGYVTPGNRIVAEKGILGDLKRNSRVRIEVGQLWPSFEEKTLIDSAAVGFSTPGIIGATRIESSIVPLARRRLTIRDILRSKPVTTGQLDFIKENSFTNAASPQGVDGTAKGESANTFVIGSERIRTIAHWIPLSKQVVDDVPELRRFIDEVLIYGLKLKEETELLSGDDLGEHLNGIIPQATAYAGTYVVAGDNKLDTLRHAILELNATEESCTGFVLNPRDAHDIDLLKTEDGGSNKGSYIVGDPLGGTLNVKTYWGVPVVVTNSMTSGRFLAGDFSKAIIGDRMDATVDMSESHDDYFTKNKLAIRCEERLALAVLRGSAFRYGSF